MNIKGIELGVFAVDRVTGFSGVVTGITYYAFSSPQAQVQPRLKPDGAWEESRWIDLTRLDMKAGEASMKVGGFKVGVKVGE